jgi:ElaB/YqjD/DUF883 family membrane-anchored ribosome-binding protein
MDEFESSERPAEKAGEHAAEGAKDMKSAVSAKAEEIRTAARTKAETLGKQLEEYVRGDPIKAILIAAGVGLRFGSKIEGGIKRFSARSAMESRVIPQLDDANTN